jgi:hypothetical protein
MARLDGHDIRFNEAVNQLEYDSGAEVWLPAAPVAPPFVPTGTTVGSLSFTNVSADINATTVFTPTVSGMYLYSFYGIPTVNAGSQYGDGPNLYLRWTDEGGAQAYFQFAGNLDGIHSDGANQAALPIWAVAGQPITFNTASGNYATARWNFHLTVTKL